MVVGPLLSIELFNLFGSCFLDLGSFINDSYDKKLSKNRVEKYR